MGAHRHAAPSREREGWSYLTRLEQSNDVPRGVDSAGGILAARPPSLPSPARPPAARSRERSAQRQRRRPPSGASERGSMPAGEDPSPRVRTRARAAHPVAIEQGPPVDGTQGGRAELGPREWTPAARLASDARRAEAYHPTPELGERCECRARRSRRGSSRGACEPARAARCHSAGEPGEASSSEASWASARVSPPAAARRERRAEERRAEERRVKSGQLKSGELEELPGGLAGCRARRPPAPRTGQDIATSWSRSSESRARPAPIATAVNGSSPRTIGSFVSSRRS